MTGLIPNHIAQQAFPFVVPHCVDADTRPLRNLANAKRLCIHHVQVTSWSRLRSQASSSEVCRIATTWGSAAEERKTPAPLRFQLSSLFLAEARRRIQILIGNERQGWLRGRDLNPRPLGYERNSAQHPARTISPNANISNALRLTPIGS